MAKLRQRPWARLLALLALVPGCSAQNASNVLQVLPRYWSGLAYADASASNGVSLPLYLIKPKATTPEGPGKGSTPMTDAQCQGVPGYPSQCPIHLMSLSLEKALPTQGSYIFNMTLFGDVAISSPNSTGSPSLPIIHSALVQNA